LLLKKKKKGWQEMFVLDILLLLLNLTICMQVTLEWMARWVASYHTRKGFPFFGSLEGGSLEGALRHDPKIKRIKP
jgi:hypothetical protein